jgi:hypothetical protein
LTKGCPGFAVLLLWVFRVTVKGFFRHQWEMTAKPFMSSPTDDGVCNTYLSKVRSLGLQLA